MKLIQTATKREFALTKAENKRLPKRFAGTVDVTIDGEKVKAPVTTNRAWSADAEHVLEYFWIEVKGVAYYVTSDYAETASSLAGEYTTAEGSGPKPAKRITALVDKEAKRIELFKSTWEARHAA